MIFVLFTFLVVIGGVNLVPAPSYIVPCSFSDPEFEKCAIADASNFVKQLKNGDPNLMIPPVETIKFPTLYANGTKGFSMTVTDVFIGGLSDLQFISIKKIPMINRIEAIIKSSKIYASGNFTIDGIFNGVEVSGKDPGLLTFYDTIFYISFDWDPIEKDGVKYTNVVKSSFKYKYGTSIIKIDVEPGNNLNEVINKNPEVFDEVTHDSLEPYLGKMFSVLTSSLFTLIPYHDLFSE